MELLTPLSPWAQLRAPRLPRRLVQLFLGLVLYGASMGMMVESHLGLDPWDVLHEGLATSMPLSFGMIVIVTGVAVLLLWIPLRQAPGLGTVANVVVIGLATDATLMLLETPEGLGARTALLVGGVGLNGLAGALYIGAQLGPGPRDGLMTGLVRRTGLSVRLVRTTLEVLVLGTGFVLGGTVGVGTVLYAVAIGPLLQLFLPWVVVDLSPDGGRGRGSCRASRGSVGARDGHLDVERGGVAAVEDAGERGDVGVVASRADHDVPVVGDDPVRRVAAHPAPTPPLEPCM